MRALLAALMLGWAAACAADDDAGAGHAVVLVYHHVSDATPASTSVSPATFDRHLSFLAERGYRVWPLSRVLDAVFRGAETLPDDVVAITFDDAYESVFTEARPRLAARGWPFSVFVNTDAIDAGHAPYMGWTQLARLAEEGVEIGNHSASHGHFARPDAGETVSAWRERVRADIARADERIREQTGHAPRVFAYPYGEDSEALAALVGERYPYAVVQRSGAVGAAADPLAVPRFPMATGFSSLDRLELAVRSRPLPLAEVRPGPAGPDGDIERLTLKPADDFDAADRLSCFSAAGRRLERDRGDDGRIRIDLAGLGRPGRNKINCTAPAADGSGDYHWYSFQWLVSGDDPG